MLSNQEIIYIVYYVVERILSLLIMGSYGAATFGVLLGFIINLGIIHLLIKYDFKQLANTVLVVGILFSIISQILCFKNLTSCNFREGMDEKKKDNNIIKNPSPSSSPPSSPPSQNGQKAKLQKRRIRKMMSLQTMLKNDKNRHLNKDSNWSPYSNELSDNSLGSSIK